MPYVSIAIYNDLDEIYIGYEGIITTERIEPYDFSLSFMCTQIPEQLKEDVYVVSRDSIFDKFIIRRFSFSNAKFIIDHFHYFIKILLER